MRKTKKLLVLTLLATCLFTGCGKDDNLKNSSNDSTVSGSSISNGNVETILKVGDEKISLGEFNIYIEMAIAEFSMFSDEIWSMDMGDGQTFSDYMKEQIVEQIRQVKVCYAKAVEQKLELSEEEKEEAEENVKDYMDSLENDYKNTKGITEDIVRKVIMENMYVNKLFDKITASVDTKVSDDEAHQTTTYNLQFTTIELDEDGDYLTDEDGNYKYVSDDEKKALKEQADKALKELRDGADIQEIAEKYSVDDFSGEYTYGKGEADEIYEQTSSGLKDGEISDVIETEYGYNIVKMIAEEDEDAIEDKKEEIINQRKNDRFNDYYNEWVTEYTFSKDDIDSSLLAKIDLANFTE